MSQKIMLLGSRKPLLRAPLIGGFIEDAQAIDFALPDIKWPKPANVSYSCVLEAIKDGWELMGQPVKDGWFEMDGQNTCFWSWWLVKKFSYSMGMGMSPMEPFRSG